MRRAEILLAVVVVMLASACAKVTSSDEAGIEAATTPDASCVIVVADRCAKLDAGLVEWSCPIMDGGLLAMPDASCTALFAGTNVPVEAESFCCPRASGATYGP